MIRIPVFHKTGMSRLRGGKLAFALGAFLCRISTCHIIVMAVVGYYCFPYFASAFVAQAATTSLRVNVLRLGA